MTPLVSVVVPTYNVEKYLDKCIRSIVDQTYKNLEIILVDDGSTDSCPAICDAWAQKDSRIHVVHKENQGLGMARNTGIESANGEYICFLDSDDYLDLSTVEKCVNALLENEAQAALYGLVDVDENYDLISKDVNFNLSPLVYKNGAVKDALLPELISHDFSVGEAHRYPFSSCTGLFSLQVIKENNLLFLSERDIISEDSFFLFQLYSKLTSVVLVPEALYFHLINTASLTMSYRNDRQSKINDFYERSKALFRELSFSEELYTRLTMLYHSFSISALKQIAASDLSEKEKRRLVDGIIKEEVFQNSLDPTALSKEKRSVSVFMKVARLRMSFLCYLLLIIKGT